MMIFSCNLKHISAAMISFFMLIGLCFPINAQTKPQADWLLNATIYKATIKAAPSGKEITLNNGLVKRTFRLNPNLVCTDYTNLINGQQLLRSVKPEARLSINGKSYNVGGLIGQKENAYLLPEWIDNFSAGKNDFQLKRFEIKALVPGLNWRSKFWASNHHQPAGQQIDFYYQPGAPELAGLEVTVSYELYDGLPLIVKSLSIKNKGDQSFKINRVVSEVLGMVEEQSAVVGTPVNMAKPQGIYLETNYAFNNAMRYDLSDQTTHWKADSTYTSQVNYDYQTPCLLEIYPDKAPGIDLQKGETLNAVRTNELLMDSYDRERRGLWRTYVGAVNHTLLVCKPTTIREAPRAVCQSRCRPCP